MTDMLASVNCVEEALLAHQLGATIIDMKQPAQGALGALAVEEVKQIVNALPADCITSATIGDLPMQPELVEPAILAMATSGVNYIKIGLFAEGDTLATLKTLQAHSSDLALIAVLFADQTPDFAWLPIIAECGFRGVMLDTQDKNRGGLTQVLPMPEIQAFVTRAKQLNLLCGLAGSLKLQQVGELLPLQVDYLGFRGGLCIDNQRTALLDSAKFLAIKHALSAI